MKKNFGFTLSLFPNEVEPRTRFHLARVNLGFTLIEVLVVATIIGILASIALVNYQSLNKKARDAKRKADLQEVRSALEIYKTDQIPTRYPAGPYGTMISTLQTGGYLSSSPQDPQNSSKSYTYYYSRLTETIYRLCAYLEAKGADDPSCPITQPCGGNPVVNCNYGFLSP